MVWHQLIGVSYVLFEVLFRQGLIAPVPALLVIAQSIFTRVTLVGWPQVWQTKTEFQGILTQPGESFQPLAVLINLIGQAGVFT